MYSIPAIFGLVGVTILIGFLGTRLFKRTGIPELVPVLVLGLLIGPVLGLVEAEPLIDLAPAFGAIALVIILFNAGLNLDLYRVLKQIPRATLLAVMGFVLSVLVTAGVANLFLELSIYRSLLLGCILGGSSSIIVLPIVQALKVDKKIQTILSLESTLTDIFVVVMALIVIEFIIGGTMDITSTFQIIASRFSVGIILGLVIGLLWLSVFPAIRRDPYRYTATLFVAFLVYAVSEFLGGSGPLSTLIFGIILGNGPSISEMLKLKREIVIGSDVLIFHSEFSFLVRSFFFVYIGIISSIRDPFLIIFGVIISVLLLNVRLVASYVSSLRSGLKKYRLLTAAMLPRGLATAALCTLPVGLGIAGTESFPDIGFVVILTTTMISVAGTVFLKRSRNVLGWRSSEYLEEDSADDLIGEDENHDRL